MSQHKFTAPAATGEMLDIMCGYDRPLDHFFLSIRPVLDEHEEREDLHFESMYEILGAGYNNPDGVINELAERKIEFPRPLYVMLQDDELQDQLAYQQRTTRNAVYQWPLLDEARATLAEMRMDQHIIGSMLLDEESDDDELLQAIRASVGVLTDEAILRELIRVERPKAWTQFNHSVDFAHYFQGKIACWT